MVSNRVEKWTVVNGVLVKDVHEAEDMTQCWIDGCEICAESMAILLEGMDLSVLMGENHG